MKDDAYPADRQHGQAGADSQRQVDGRRIRIWIVQADHRAADASREGEPVQLSSRAFDILSILLKNAGKIVTSPELISRVWPNVVVEEANLRINIAALRRTLGEGRQGRRFIVNVRGKGYCFVAPVVAVQTRASASAGNFAAVPTSSVPARPARLIGRTEVVRNLVAQLSRQRFMTVVGPGGIGKTATALAVAHESATSFRHGARFVDLAPLSDPALVPSALASVLNVAVGTEDSVSRLLAHLLDKNMLVVLDSCEHVIDAAAALAEEIYRGAPEVSILTTSREPLLTEGEAIVRLAPLGLPSPALHMTAAEGLTYPALQLFVERAAARLDDFELTDADAPVVAEICRRLDGIPLAIELAAGRLDALGVRGLADHLNDRFKLLTRGRRTALPRHQTLSATLDWSHDLLSAEQKAVFRRLGVFAGWFTSEAAAFLVTGNDLSASEVVGVVADLVAKSLVAANVEGAVPHYRLLETTRAYAFERLVEADEVEPVLRLHAQCYRKLFERAEAEWEARPIKDWLATYARQIDDVRSALDWAFSPQGDTALGVALTVAAAPLWYQLSLINECCERVDQALSALAAGKVRNDVLEMKLHAARGWSLMYTAGAARASGAAWAPAYQLAESLNDTDYRLRSLWGLWAGKMNNAEFTAAREIAEQFCTLAAESDDPSDRHIGDRLMGAALHFLGDQVGARDHIERMLRCYTAPLHRSDVVRYQFDQRLTAKITLSRVLWLQGSAKQALSTVDSSVEEAQSLGHTLTLCNTLAQAACPVALLAGDLERAERFTAMLLQETERYALGIWHVYANCYRGQLLVRRGDMDAGLPLVRAAVDELRGVRFIQYHTAFLITLAEGLLSAGQAAEALETIDEALALSAHNSQLWCSAEIPRIKGEVVLRLGSAPSCGAAVDYFLGSLKLARKQGALAWELRAATSMARWKRDQASASEARDLLAPVVERFCEDSGTADLMAARLLLDDLAQRLRDG